MQRTAVLAATALLALVLAVLAHLAPSPVELLSTVAPAPAVEQTAPVIEQVAPLAPAGDDTLDAISEDDPSYDCATSGNHQCGIGTASGPVLLPAADGGEGYFCPAGVTPEQNDLGVIVCDYGRNA